MNLFGTVWYNATDHELSEKNDENQEQKEIDEVEESSKGDPLVPDQSHAKWMSK